MKTTMKTYRLSFFALFCAVVFLPGTVFAGPVIRSGDSVSIAADQVIEGDFYAGGGTVSLSGTAEGDAYIAGGTVTVNAEIAEDLVVAGGTVQVHAPVGDDLRIVGGDVTVAEHVGGDLVILGGSVQVLSTAQIEGDILFFGGNIDVKGGVKGSVVGFGDNVRLDSGIGGDVKVTASQLLTLGDRAEVLGNVVYKSPSEIARAQNAVVVGDLIQEQFSSESGSSRYAVLPLLMTLFAALTVFLLFRNRLQGVVDVSKTSYGGNGLVGLGVFLLVPVVSILLLVSVLGFIPGIVLFLSYLLLLIAAWIISGIVLGTFALKFFMKTEKISVLSVIVGVVLFDILVLVPYIGVLLALAIFLVVLGGISRLLYNVFR